jgi:hypothetical protein
MNDFLLILVLGLATFRITWLVTRDDFVPIRLTRNWIVGLRPDVMAKRPTGRNAERTSENAPYRDHWWLGELVTCTWCASGWISFGIVGIVWLLQGILLPVFAWWAVWGIGSFMCKLIG